jgi:hypothetical protein
MGSLYANPLLNPSAFDVVVCAGVSSPGVFKLRGGGRPYKWDIKDAAAAQGATETYLGWKVSENIVGRFEFWESSQIDEFFNTFLPVLKYDATKTNPQPIQIVHPVLLANDITSVVTQNIGPLTHEGLQLWIVEVEWAEYRQPPKKNVTTTPTGTNTNGDPKKKKPTAQDAQDLQIQQLLTEALKPV